MYYTKEPDQTSGRPDPINISNKQKKSFSNINNKKNYLHSPTFATGLSLPVDTIIDMSSNQFLCTLSNIPMCYISEYSCGYRITST